MTVTRRFWCSIACPRTFLRNRTKWHPLRCADKIPNLAVILAAIMLLCDCHSEKNRISDVTVDSPLHEAVSESPVQQPSPSPPVDQRNSECGPSLPNLALGTEVISSSHMCGLLNPDENHDFFSIEKVQDQPSNPRFAHPNVSFSYPLWQDGRTEWITSANVADTLSPPNARFTDREQPSPNDLWNVGSGATYRHLLENGWIDGVNTSVESNSEYPLNSFSQVNERVKAFLQIPQGQHHFWLLSLSYSSSNEWSLPIAKVEHTWRPSDWLQANLGLGLPTTEHPQNNLSLDFSVKLLGRVKP